MSVAPNLRLWSVTSNVSSIIYGLAKADTKKKEVLTFYKFEQTVSIIEYKNKTKKGVMKYDNKKNQLEIWCDLDKLKKQIKWIHDCYIEKLEIGLPQSHWL